MTAFPTGLSTFAETQASANVRGQVSRDAAEVYEEFFVPALFREWAPRLVRAAHLEPGLRVLDVACGTGVLAREAARHVAPSGSVTGLDRNDGMLAVARRAAAHIDWRLGLAEALPFEKASFDAVVSQFGLMFFEHRERALREMWRVLRPGGRLALAVWDSIEESPGYAAMADLLGRLFGTEAADALRTPYVLGDQEKLAALFADSGIAGVRIETLEGTARFPSLEAWVHTDVKGWTLAGTLDEDQFRTLLTEARTELASFVRSDGTVAFPSPAHVVTARNT